jgi:hypothetical protein
MTLTREQKINRAVSRHNNKLARELPLLAPVMQTDHAEQSARYGAMDADLAEYKERLDAFSEELKRRGEAYRAKAASLYTKSEMDEFEELYAKVFGNLGWEYFADYWRKLCPKKEEIT